MQKMIVQIVIGFIISITTELIMDQFRKPKSQIHFKKKDK